MVKQLVLILFALIQFSAGAQEQRAGILKFNLGLSQGFMLKYDSRPFFADGFVEYFPNDQISIKGSCNQIIADRTEPMLLKQYTGISFGAFRHFAKGMSDFSIGVQPGVVLEKPGIVYENYSPDLQVTPSLMFTVQYTLFFSGLFHFYLAASENTSYFRGAPDGHINTSWISLTGGLGWHLRTRNNEHGKMK